MDALAIANGSVVVAAARPRHAQQETQREVADISGVTEVTIRNRYKEIVGQLGLKIDLS